jgi:hypothetical protein
LSKGDSINLNGTDYKVTKETNTYLTKTIIKKITDSIAKYLGGRDVVAEKSLIDANPVYYQKEVLANLKAQTPKIPGEYYDYVGIYSTKMHISDPYANLQITGIQGAQGVQGTFGIQGNQNIQVPDDVVQSSRLVKVHDTAAKFPVGRRFLFTEDI